MTVLVLDNPEMLARAALLSGSYADSQGTEAGLPHRTRFHYGFNKRVPDACDAAIMRQHAAYLKNHPGVRVRIHCHIDNLGSPEYNRFPARLRANAVARLLIQDRKSTRLNSSHVR